ncbi:MAG: TonB-dependent receptor domain-containing protein [Sediminibacterium sp.]
MLKHLRLVMMGFFCIARVLVFAQDENDMDINSISIKVASNRIFGKITDVITTKPLEAVSVQLYLKDSKGNDSLVNALLTKANGDFRFTNLPKADSFKLVISSLAYAAKNFTVLFTPDNVRKIPETAFFEKDLGNIALEQDATTLTAVVVKSTAKPALEMGIDRKIFNVEKSLTATGGTAIDVMKNIPSVSVDVEGNVQLRNSQPQIFVDGRPTILTLDQIPSDNIETIELITNPSAKFDAASSGGIINIVLKKNKRIGLNGVASIGGGYPDIYNGNLALNARQGKVNLFASGSINQSGGIARGESLRENRVNGVADNYFNQYSNNARLRRFNSIRFGLDFFLDNRNTISFTQGIVDGKFTNREVQDQYYFNQQKVLQRTGDRLSENRAGFNRYNSQLNFTHKFPENGKELTANINYNYGNGSNLSNIRNAFYNTDGTPYAPEALVRNNGTNRNKQVTFQLDYSDPIGENAKLETGLRSYMNDVSSSFNAFAIGNGIETKLPLSNNIRYKESVHAGYITYSNKINSFSYQAGLRAEYSEFEGELLDSARKFGYTYPNSWDRLFDGFFPSLFLTKTINDNTDIQLNYSRRIRRPNFRQLNPFVDITDPVNLNQGNPQLQPEFTNSFEFNYNTKYKSGSFLGVLYFRNNQRDITRFSDTITAAQYQQLNNAAVDPNAILNTFINAQYTNRWGAEFTLQHKIGADFDLTPSINLQYRKVKAIVGKLDLSNQGFNWESKLIANYRFPTKQTSFFKNLSLQMVGEYESMEVTAQGKSLAQYSIDMAIRKDFLKDKKASLTFALNDVFNTNRNGNIFDTDLFYQQGYNRRNVRNFRITFSYKFGSATFKLFNNRNNRDEED